MSLLSDIQNSVTTFVAKVADLVTQTGYLVAVITGPASGSTSLVDVGPRTLRTVARVLYEIQLTHTFVATGVYDPINTYSAGDAVSFNGFSYVSIIDTNLGNDPSSNPADWMQLAGDSALVVKYYGFYGATVTDAVAALPSGGTLRIPAAQLPALPGAYPNVVLEYDGPVTLHAGYTDNLALSDGVTFQKLWRIQEAGSFSDHQAFGAGIVYEAIGSGVDGAAQASIGFGISAFKTNWTNRAASAFGEVWAAQFNVRTAGPDGTASDSTIWGGSCGNVGLSGSTSIFEASSLNFNDDFSIHKSIALQGAAINSESGNEFSTGFVISATAGSHDRGLLIVQPGGTFGHAIDVDAGRALIDMDGSIVTGFATGGNKGAGTINAKGVYDDGSLLTCPALAKEFIEFGKIDLAKWDALVPDHVVPAHKKKVYARDENGRLLPDKFEQVHRETGPKIYDEPVLGRDGKPLKNADGKVITAKRGYLEGIAVIEHPSFTDQDVAEQRTPRIHATAHLFKTMVDAGFDPRDPAQYIAKLKRDEALPGMPAQKDWQHAALSTGELHSRLWLATEMLALVVINQQERLDATEARLTALEAGSPLSSDGLAPRQTAIAQKTPRKSTAPQAK